MDAFDFVNDPIAASQVEELGRLLQDEWSETARDGFLVIAGRFVDEMGNDRTGELATLFKTHLPTGRLALRRSLEELFAFVGSLRRFEAEYPVLINDPEPGLSSPVFPQLRILGISDITPTLNRALGSTSRVEKAGELVRDFIVREGRLPDRPLLAGLVLRQKPVMHWCSYEQYESPLATRAALQILPEWNNDCEVRATLSTTALEGMVFVAFNGDSKYSDGQAGHFAGYYLEPTAQDHAQLPGGGIQVGVVGSPQVLTLEEWVRTESRWETIWNR